MESKIFNHKRYDLKNVVDMSINVRAESAGHADKIVRERVRKVKGIRITNVGD